MKNPLARTGWSLSSERFMVNPKITKKKVLKMKAPDKKYYPIGGQCIQQKKVNLERVYECLRDCRNEVFVEPNIAKKALKAINEMLKYPRND